MRRGVTARHKHCACMLSAKSALALAYAYLRAAIDDAGNPDQRFVGDVLRALMAGIQPAMVPAERIERMCAAIARANLNMPPAEDGRSWSEEEINGAYRVLSRLLTDAELAIAIRSGDSPQNSQLRDATRAEAEAALRLVDECLTRSNLDNHIFEGLAQTLAARRGGDAQSTRTDKPPSRNAQDVADTTSLASPASDAAPVGTRLAGVQVVASWLAQYRLSKPTLTDQQKHELALAIDNAVSPVPTLADVEAALRAVSRICSAGRD